MSTFDVIIPAGGRVDAGFGKVVGTRSKALIALDGRTILERTIAAFRESGQVGRIVVIGSTEVTENADAAKADAALREGASGPENISRGLNYLNESEHPPDRILICTCDLPFITADSVNRFLALAPHNVDFCVPLITEESFLDAFPQAEATFVELQDGTFTTGCLYSVNPSALKRSLPHIDRLFLTRKSKLGMARLLGMRFVMLMLSKRLTVKDIERKVQEILGCSGAAVPHSPPELALDIDYVEDYHYVVQSLRTMRKVAAIR